MMILRKTILTFIAAIFCLSPIVQLPIFAASIDNELGEKEVKMGEEAAAEIAKQHKLSDNAEDLKRVREIGQRIAEVANKMEIPALYGSSKVTPFNYTFDIIEEDDVNAFCVPGGRIYVYRGLLDFVQSDHELAGVLAHEIVHASHHHMVYLLKKQASLNNIIAIALLGAIATGASGTDIGNIMLGVQLYQIAKLNGYGQEAERDSDKGAILYLKEAGYNPVGLLTFLERLARRPELVDYGIYRSHPLDADRVKATKDFIKSLGLPINRRDTINAIIAEVKMEKVDGKELPSVYLDDKLLIRPAPADGKSSQQRAEQLAEAVNKTLDSGLKMHQLSSEGAVVIAKEKPIIEVSEEDAKLMGKTPEKVATEAAAAIRNVIWQQMMNTVH